MVDSLEVIWRKKVLDKYPDAKFRPARWDGFVASNKNVIVATYNNKTIPPTWKVN
jgi:hypothetical protein